MVVTTCGAVWGCGEGERGQLGVGDRADRHAPVRVGGEEAFGQSKVRMVACGNFHTVAVTEEGAVWSWGSGYRGRLGHNDDHNRLAPERVGQERFGGAKIVTGEDVQAALDDYIPSQDAAMMHYMELLAVFEASSRKMLPEKYRNMSTAELNASLRLQQQQLLKP